MSPHVYDIVTINATTLAVETPHKTFRDSLSYLLADYAL
ncbi:MAG: hypothetical protein K0Q71_5088 [Thermomicrobiales bacterium]|jgi:hypothetical protein|nr:hypothetical protein [Thermomicrobiales bacterium]